MGRKGAAFTTRGCVLDKTHKKSSSGVNPRRTKYVNPKKKRLCEIPLAVAGGRSEHGNFAKSIYYRVATRENPRSFSPGVGATFVVTRRLRRLDITDKGPFGCWLPAREVWKKGAPLAMAFPAPGAGPKGLKRA